MKARNTDLIDKKKEKKVYLKKGTAKFNMFEYRFVHALPIYIYIYIYI